MNNNKNLPKVTFSIVTLNEELRLPKCLDAINNQEYPKDKIEILVVDGGSKDSTKEIAKRNGANLLLNKDKLAEPGLKIAYIKAKGDYMIFMAADNIIHDPKWTHKMIKPFLDDPENIVASFSKVDNDPRDNIWNKYINEDAEPFSAFVFGNASHPSKFSKIYPVEKETIDYVIYKYSERNFPLIALAQCTMLKAGLDRTEESRFDDILPIVDLIKNRKKIAFVKNTGIFHYSFKGYKNFYTKFNKRIYNSIKTNSFKARESNTSKSRKLRKYLFILYGMTIIIPFIESVLLTYKKRQLYMLLHPVCCFTISYLIVYNILKVTLWEKLNSV